MTAVDFSAFVERLAQVSGEVILPFFRSAIRAEDKSLGGVFDPVTEADRGAEAAMRRLIAQTFPRSRRDWRGIWARPPRGGICLGPRSHRRDQELRFRIADLGDLDRAHASRAAGLRDDGSAVHARAVLRRRQGRKLAHARPLARRRAAFGMDDPAPAYARLRVACRGDARDDEPIADPGRRRPGGLCAGRKGGSAHALWRRLLRLLRASRPASSTW